MYGGTFRNAIVVSQRMNRIHRALFLLFGLCFFLVLWTWANFIPAEKIRCTTPECWKQYEKLRESMIEEKNRFVSPLTRVKGIMLGGVQRSGVNLLRTMLNAHPQLDCSYEVNLAKWKNQDMNDQAVLYDIAKTVDKEMPKINDDRLVCIKADFDYLEVLSKILPNVKVIVVIRDGRAVAHSITSHGGMIGDFDTALTYWSKSLTIMLDQCYALGDEMCMIMIYEKLVVDTEVWMRAALNFASLSWSPDVLNHSQITDDKYYEK